MGAFEVWKDISLIPLLPTTSSVVKFASPPPPPPPPPQPKLLVVTLRRVLVHLAQAIYDDSFAPATSSRIHDVKQIFSVNIH